MKIVNPATSRMYERFRTLSAQGSAALPPVPAPTPPAPAPAVAAFELRLIEILRRPVEGGNTHEANRVKEHEIGEVFARLSVSEAAALHQRLSSPAPLDDLAAAFGRLMAERRARLLAFLGDAPRRATIAATRAA